MHTLTYTHPTHLEWHWIGLPCSSGAFQPSCSSEFIVDVDVNYSVLCILINYRGVVERLGYLFMIIVVTVLKWTLKIAIKKVTLVNCNVIACSPQTFSLQMYYLQPRNCHGDYLILVDHERLYLHSRIKLVLEPIFSHVDTVAMKTQRATKLGL